VTGATTYTLTNGTGAVHIASLVPVTGNATQCRFGFQDVLTASAVQVDGAFWNVTGVTSPFNFTPVVSNNSVRTIGSQVQLFAGADQYYKFTIHVINRTNVNFQIYNFTNNALLTDQNLTSNIPTTVGRETTHAVVCNKVGGTTAQVMARLDYIAVYNNDTLVMKR
jgi:hypothetical protein